MLALPIRLAAYAILIIGAALLLKYGLGAIRDILGVPVLR